MTLYKVILKDGEELYITGNSTKDVEGLAKGIIGEGREIAMIVKAKPCSGG